MNSTGKMERLKKTVSSSRGMNRINLVVFEGSSFADIESIGGEHFYGLLIGYEGNERRRVELKRELTDMKEVDYLNRIDGVSELSAWKLGDETVRFPSSEALVQCALKTWKKMFPSADALVRSTSFIDGPQEPLAAKSQEILWILRGFWKARNRLGEQEGTAGLIGAYNKWLYGN